MSLRFALLCSSPETGEGSFSPFSYGAYRIQSAVLHGANTPNIDAVVFERSNRSIEEWVEEIEAYDPHIIGVSAFVWSFPTWLELTRRLKEKKPDRLIIIGGPSASPSLFNLPVHQPSAAWVDVLVTGEGEWAIQEIVRRFEKTKDRRDLLGISNVWVSNGITWKERPDLRFTDQYHLQPSPFQNGLAPKGVTAHLEASRGCPLGCRFCQWGDISVKGVSSNLDFLVQELSAFKELEINGTLLVDAGLNLNVRAFQNLMAAERQVQVLAGKPFHTEIYPSLLTDEHTDFLATTQATVGIGLQSVNKDVLKFHKRHFNSSKLEEVIEKLNHCTDHISLEIIMGLPGDSPEGFLRTLDYAKSLNVDHVRIFHCLVLPTALMDQNPERSQMHFNPITLEIESCLGWSRQDIDEMALHLNEVDYGVDDYSIHSWPHPEEAKDPSYYWGRMVSPSVWHAEGRRSIWPRGQSGKLGDKDTTSIAPPIEVSLDTKREHSVTMPTEVSHSTSNQDRGTNSSELALPEASPEIETGPLITKECRALQKIITPVIYNISKGTAICESVELKDQAFIVRVVSRQGAVAIELNPIEEGKNYYKSARGIGFRYIGSVENSSLLKVIDVVIIGLVSYAEKAIRRTFEIQRAKSEEELSSMTS